MPRLTSNCGYTQVRLRITKYRGKTVSPDNSYLTPIFLYKKFHREPAHLHPIKNQDYAKHL